ncbi:hypothetical protein [Mesorhizobium comanense]|uniref:hypothetical protein n=1 Tax=Mesorhizobium comanense TaxID=2502215 RepID=UPI0010F72D97|nr:hypothetical protein [Mesorhizobium comanense]
MTQDIETIGIADLLAPPATAQMPGSWPPPRASASGMERVRRGLWKAVGLLALAEAISGRPDGESAIVGCDMKVGVSAERADESRCF